MSTGSSGALQKLRACARTVFCLRPSARKLAYFFAAAVLCLTDPGLGRMSLGICLIPACAVSELAACVLGVAAGSFAFAGLQQAAASCAAALSVLCARLLIPKGRQGVSVPAVAAGTCILTGMIRVVEAGFSASSILFLCCHASAIVGGIALFRAALIQKSYPAQAAALCALLPGLAALRLPGGWSAAAFALAWISFAPAGPVYACAGCAIVSALLPQSALCFSAVCIGALSFRLLRARPVPASALACLAYLIVGARTRCFGFSACAAAGTALAMLLHPERILPQPPRAPLPRFPAQRELRQAALAMEQASAMLCEPKADPRRELEAILDAGEEQVCRNCAKYASCRGGQDPPFAAEYSQNAAHILSNGEVTVRDLPMLSHCIHPEAFLTAVNDAMDDERAGRRIRRRLREARTAAQAQYALMGDLLRQLAERLYGQEHPVHFSPEIFAHGVGRSGSTVSGDRGAAFAGPGATYYVLLCDGMGAGEAAARESRQALELLRTLLLSGADARSALRTLNGVYLLRDDGCFSTVDLLRINLTSGDAILYKWGAAASYLKRSRGLRLLGGAGLPPGLGPDEGAEQIHLNLDRGDVLVLLSDGLAGQETRRRLEHCRSLSPQDVARSLFAGRGPGADDCTAVAVRLKRIGQREPVSV